MVTAMNEIVLVKVRDDDASFFCFLPWQLNFLALVLMFVLLFCWGVCNLIQGC